MKRKRKQKQEEANYELPDLPPKEDAELALAHAQYALAETPRLKQKAKEVSDPFVEAIFKAIAERGIT